MVTGPSTAAKVAVVVLSVFIFLGLFGAMIVKAKWGIISGGSLSIAAILGLSWLTHDEISRRERRGF